MAGLNAVLGQLCAHAGDQHVVIGVLHIRAIFEQSKVNQLANQFGSGVSVFCQLTEAVSTTFLLVRSEDGIQDVFTYGGGHGVQYASGFQVLQVLTDYLERHVVVALHSEDVAQALNVSLGVLAVTGFGTAGVHQTALLQEANLGCANSGELEVELAKNLTDGPALNVTRVTVRVAVLHVL